MLTGEMLAFMYAYNQTRLIPDTINRRIHTYRVECRTARKLYILTLGVRTYAHWTNAHTTK